MTKLMKKVARGIKEVKRRRKSKENVVSQKVLSDFEAAANFIIERHKNTIKELEKY